MKKAIENLTNLTTGNLITFLDLCYLKIYQNASVKCHSVNETRNVVVVDIFPQYLYHSVVICILIIHDLLFLPISTNRV